MYAYTSVDNDNRENPHKKVIQDNRTLPNLAYLNQDFFKIIWVEAINYYNVWFLFILQKIEWHKTFLVILQNTFIVLKEKKFIKSLVTAGKNK